MRSAVITLLVLSAVATAIAQTGGGAGGSSQSGGMGQNNTGVGPNNMSPAPTMPPGPRPPNQTIQVPGTVSTGIGSNQFGFGSNTFTVSNQFSFGTNQMLFNSNRFTVNTNVHGLTPTGRTTNGLQQLPPGFQPVPMPPKIQVRSNNPVSTP